LALIVPQPTRCKRGFLKIKYPPSFMVSDVLLITNRSGGLIIHQN
jgi:hypothetical protein